MDSRRVQTAEGKKVVVHIWTEDPHDSNNPVALVNHRPIWIPPGPGFRVHSPDTPWTTDEDHRLRLALARNIHLRPIPLHRVSQEIPWKPLVEVFMRINKLLQEIQGDLFSQAVQFPVHEGYGAAANNQHQLVQFQPEDQKSLNPNPMPSVEEQRASSTKKRTPKQWTEEEHEKFIEGTEKYGWGNWKMITENFVPTRTPFQLASHGQKHKKKQNSTDPKNITLGSDDDVGSSSRSVSPAPEGEL